MITRPLYEKFEYEDVRLQVITAKDDTCKGCYFRLTKGKEIEVCTRKVSEDYVGTCFKEVRSDHTDVIFRKLPKVKSQFKNPKLT